MNLTKFARTLALGLIVFTAAVTSFAAPARPCSCSYCPTVAPTTHCKFNNATTTCGEWLSVTLCPAQ
ncbi:MAG TPA: hypothetical protein VMW27_29260 [Thermoanaerobaculia bacterium]|nr:hypothetical protein [Thermoanaerobaculia bacterium]